MLKAVAASAADALGITSLTGDVTATGPGAAAATLASTIVAGGPTGSATVSPIITYDAKGRLTAVSSATIAPAIGSVTGLGTGVATALGNTAGGAGSFALQSSLASYLPLAGGTMTGGIGFSTTNTLDIGTNSSTLAPRTVYAGTSFVGPTGTFATAVNGGDVTVASGKVLTLGNAAVTGLTAGVLAALTNATVVITDSTGQAYRIPCII